MNKKKLIATIMLLAGTGLMIYGYWGAFTAAGNKVYDEMDGLYAVLHADRRGHPCAHCNSNVPVDTQESQEIIIRFSALPRTCI